MTQVHSIRELMPPEEILEDPENYAMMSTFHVDHRNEEKWDEIWYAPKAELLSRMEQDHWILNIPKGRTYVPDFYPFLGISAKMRKHWPAEKGTPDSYLWQIAYHDWLDTPENRRYTWWNLSPDLVEEIDRRKRALGQTPVSNPL